ncbi:MAG: cytochrome C oxidase subunit IV family protein [Anaerolineales bacterium]|jgi:cytochrome c oxidase subunit IV
MDEKKKAQIYEKGIIVLIVLSVLTIGELWFALFGLTWWSILILVALTKAFLVVRDYMHIGRLFAGEEEY